MPLPHPFATNFEAALDQIRQVVGLPPQACPADIVAKVRELAAKSAPADLPRRGCAACDRGDFQLGHHHDCPNR